MAVSMDEFGPDIYEKKDMNVPGDVDDEGDILTSEFRWVDHGDVWVTSHQAERAYKFGWKLIQTGHNNLVGISRKKDNMEDRVVPRFEVGGDSAKMLHNKFYPPVDESNVWTNRRKYLPSLSDLVDRLTIVNQKLIFISERKEEYLKERMDILHDIDLIINQMGHQLNARAILAITIIQLSNRYIWENESHVRNGAADQGPRLMLTHSINGIRNSAKNVLAEEAGGRKDYKIDCFAEGLPEEYGNWRDILA